MAAPAVYISETAYLNTFTQVQDKVAALDVIILALYAQLLVLAQQESPILEYQFNDGQTIIKSIYRTSESIMRTIGILEFMRNRLINNGRRCVEMVDKKNFNGRRYY